MFPYVVTLSVKIQDFELVKQVRPDTFRFTDKRFQIRVRINGYKFEPRGYEFRFGLAGSLN